MKNKLRLTSIFAGLFCAFTLNVQGQTWVQKASFPGAARYYDVGFSIGHYGYIGCGNNGSSFYNNFWRWNQDSNTWTAIPNYPGSGYEIAPIAFSIEGNGYVGLGWTGSGGATDLWKYDTGTKAWSAMATFPGAGRYDADVFVVGHKAWIISGSTGGSPYIGDIWMYDAHQNTWTQMNTCPAGKLEGMVSFSIGNHGYIGGGFDGSSPHNAFWQYDTANDTWTGIAPYPTTLSGDGQAFVIAAKAYICTGAVSGFTTLPIGYDYDTTAKTWSEFTNMGSNGIERGYAVAFTIGNSGYIGTGRDSVGGLLQDFWQYTPNLTGIQEIKPSVSISLFPNPSNGIMSLAYTGNIQHGELQITDLMGKLVDSREITNSNGQITLNENNLSNGMYFYQVTDSGNQITSGKFIIAK